MGFCDLLINLGHNVTAPARVRFPTLPVESAIAIKQHFLVQSSRVIEMSFCSFGVAPLPNDKVFEELGRND